MSSLLEVDYKKRPTAAEALEHEWFKKARKFKNNAEQDPLDDGLMENLVEY